MIIKILKKKFNSIKICSIFTAICFMISTLGANIYAISMTENANKKYEDVFNKASSISNEYGKITSSKDANSDITVINIQDLHCHPQTQRNIAKIIGQIADKYKLKKVYVEGGYGDIDVSWLNFIKDENIRKQAIEKLVEEGILTGSEYYKLTSGNETIQLKGIDEKKLHQDNIKRLSLIIENQDKYKELSEKINKEIGFLEQIYVNIRNKRFNSSIEDYLSGKIETKRFYRQLIKYIKDINANPEKYNNVTAIRLEDYPNISKFMTLRKVSKNINVREVTQQLQIVINELKNKLPYNTYTRLLKETENFSDSQKVVELVILLCDKEGIDLDNKYKSLSEFLKSNEINRELNTVKLVYEERQLITEIRKALSYNNEEYEITFVSDFSRYFQDYLEYKLTDADWKYFETGYETFRQLYSKYATVDRIKEIESDIAELNKYYEINDIRNEIFVNNLLQDEIPTILQQSQLREDEEILKNSKEVIIAVTGGFHSQALEEILQAKEVNTIVITPTIFEGIEKATKQYKGIIKEQSKEFQHQALAYTLISCSTSDDQKKILTNLILDLVKENPQIKDMLAKDIDFDSLQYDNEIREKAVKSYREKIYGAVNEVFKNSINIKDFVLPSAEIVDDIMVKMACKFIDAGIYFSRGPIYKIEKAPYNGENLRGVSAEVYSRMWAGLQKALLLWQVNKDGIIPFSIPEGVLDSNDTIVVGKINNEPGRIVNNPKFINLINRGTDNWELLDETSVRNLIGRFRLEEKPYRKTLEKRVSVMLRNAQKNGQVVYLSDILKTNVVVCRRDANNNETYFEAVIKYNSSTGQWELVKGEEINKKYEEIEKVLKENIDRFVKDKFEKDSGSISEKDVFEKHRDILFLAGLAIIRGTQGDKSKKISQIVDNFKIDESNRTKSESSKIGNLKGYFAEFLVRFLSDFYLSPQYRLSMPVDANKPAYDLFTNDGYEIQIKAAKRRINAVNSEDKDIVGEALDKYPGIPVFATSEIAAEYSHGDNVFSYGLSNDLIEPFARKIIQILNGQLPDISQREGTWKFSDDISPEMKAYFEKLLEEGKNGENGKDNSIDFNLFCSVIFLLEEQLGITKHSVEFTSIFEEHSFDVQLVKDNSAVSVFKIKDKVTGKTYYLKHTDELDEISRTKAAYAALSKEDGIETVKVVEDNQALLSAFAERYNIKGSPLSNYSGKYWFITEEVQASYTFVNIINDKLFETELQGKPLTIKEQNRIKQAIKKINEAGIVHGDLGSNLFLKRGEHGELIVSIIDYEPWSKDYSDESDIESFLQDFRDLGYAEQIPQSSEDTDSTETSSSTPKKLSIIESLSKYAHIWEEFTFRYMPTIQVLTLSMNPAIWFGIQIIFVLIHFVRPLSNIIFKKIKGEKIDANIKNELFQQINNVSLVTLMFSLPYVASMLILSLPVIAPFGIILSPILLELIIAPATFLFSDVIVKWLTKKDSGGKDDSNIKQRKKTAILSFSAAVLAVSISILFPPLSTVSIVMLNSVGAGYLHYKYNKEVEKLEVSDELSLIKYLLENFNPKTGYKLVIAEHLPKLSAFEELRSIEIEEQQKKEREKRKKEAFESFEKALQEIDADKYKETIIYDNKEIRVLSKEHFKKIVDNINKYGNIFERLVSLAGAIKQKELPPEMEKQFLALIEESLCDTLVNLYDDKITRAHVRTVMKYTIKILNYKNQNVLLVDEYKIMLEAILHDIGKNLIPDSVLNKPGVLSDKERALIDLHSKFGYYLLEASDALQDYSKIARDHHRCKALKGELKEKLKALRKDLGQNLDSSKNKELTQEERNLIDLYVMNDIVSISDIFQAISVQLFKEDQRLYQYKYFPDDFAPILFDLLEPILIDIKLSEQNEQNIEKIKNILDRINKIRIEQDFKLKTVYLLGLVEDLVKDEYFDLINDTDGRQILEVLKYINGIYAKRKAGLSDEAIQMIVDLVALIRYDTDEAGLIEKFNLSENMRQRMKICDFDFKRRQAFAEIMGKKPLEFFLKELNLTEEQFIIEFNTNPNDAVNKLVKVINDLIETHYDDESLRAFLIFYFNKDEIEINDRLRDRLKKNNEQKMQEDSVKNVIPKLNIVEALKGLFNTKYGKEKQSSRILLESSVQKLVDFINKYKITEKDTIATKIIKSILGLIFKSVSTVKHITIDYKFIKSSEISEAIKTFDSNTYMDENGNIHIPPVKLIVDNLEELQDKYELRNTGIKVNGNSIYQIGGTGKLIYGIEGADGMDVVRAINESQMIKDSIEKLIRENGYKNIKVEVNGVIQDEGEGVRFDNGITIIGKQELQDKSAEYINGFVSSSLEIKRSMGVMYSQKALISLESLEDIEKLSQALKQGRARKIISKEQYGQLIEKGKLNMEEIIVLRESGIEIYIDSNDIDSSLKESGIMGQIIRRDGNIYIYDYYTQEETEVEEIGEENTLINIESKLVNSQKPILIDIKVLAKKFQKENILGVYKGLNTLIGNIKIRTGIGQLSETDIKSLGYNLDYNKIPELELPEELQKYTKEQIEEELDKILAQIEDNSEIRIIVKAIEAKKERAIKENKELREIKELENMEKIFIQIIKERILAKTALSKNYKEYGLKDKKLEILLGEMLFKQLDFTLEDKNIEKEGNLDLSYIDKNGTIKEVRGGKEGFMEKITQDMKKIQEMEQANKETRVAVNSIIDIILVYGDSYKNKQMARELDKNDARNYRAMMAAA